jgi:hypothetical protein
VVQAFCACAGGAMESTKEPASDASKHVNLLRAGSVVSMSPSLDQPICCDGFEYRKKQRPSCPIDRSFVHYIRRIIDLL